MSEQTLHTEDPNRLPDESTLVRLASEGDQQAFGLLYSFHYPRLYASLLFIAASHEDAQEIIQDVFLKIWKTRENLVLVRSFKDYAYILAKNLLFNQLKRQKTGRRIARSITDLGIGNTGPSPDQELLFKQYYQAALTAIARLSEQKRKVFLLRTQEGLSLDEIAAKLSISHPTVKKHLYAAMIFVKDQLKKHTETVIRVALFWAIKNGL